MKKILALVIIFLLLLFAVRGWWQFQTSSVSSDESVKTVIIPKGASVGEIATQLKKENLIKSELTFKLLARQNGLGDKLQAGTFQLSPAMSTIQIMEILSKGADDIWVTLIEGWRVEEMASEIAKNFEDNSESFVTNAEEGYMFPDTYLFPKDSTVEFIAKTLRNTFNERYSEELKVKIRKQGLSDKEGVILASLVEREGRSDKVRTEIAGILLKRLNIGMKLDVDATVQYALGYQSAEKSWWKRHITKEDKEIKSPYNTYKNPGLPPAPICNPSLSSLEAVANANPDTPYLYYYHDSKGNSHYGKTLDEHLDNVANNP